MKRIVCLCVILLCSISFAFAQGGRGRTTKKKPVVKKIDPQIAEAEKAWVVFWKNFKMSIKNRNINSFLEMMSEEYDVSGEYDRDGNCKGISNKKEAFLCVFKKNNDWWELIDWVLSKEVRIYKIRKEEEKIVRWIEVGNSEVSQSANFAYEPNGKWYFVSYGSHSE